LGLIFWPIGRCSQENGYRLNTDCDHHEDQKDGSSIAHRRTRSAQCSSATPNAIAINCAIILASSHMHEMTEGITPLRR
jgi:hypothetical protein